MNFFERYFGFGVRDDGSLEMLFLLVLSMIIVVLLWYFFQHRRSWMMSLSDTQFRTRRRDPIHPFGIAVIRGSVRLCWPSQKSAFKRSCRTYVTCNTASRRPCD